MAQDWLARRIDELGKKQVDLARLLHISEPRVSELIAGRRQVKITELKTLAQFLELPPIEVLSRIVNGAPGPATGSPVLEETVHVRGAVEAGKWIDSDDMEFPPEDWRPIDLPVDARFPKGERFGLEVRGTSMNLVYPPGTIVICVDPLRVEYDPAPGDHVVVRVRRPDGLVELTVKELVAENGELWLWPRSSDPRHQQPIQISSLDHGEDDSARIMGVVVTSILQRRLSGHLRD